MSSDADSSPPVVVAAADPAAVASPAANEQADSNASVQAEGQQQENKAEGTEEEASPSSSSSSSSSPSSSSPSPYVLPSGPRVLLLGGCGFIGRHLVSHLAHNRLVGHIVVADKVMPVMANMREEEKRLFEDKQLLTFKQADLTKDAHVSRVFQSSSSFDYVFNLCGETRFGLAERDYQLKIVETASKCAQAAAACGVKKFVEVSTAQVYKPDKSPSTELSPLSPWTLQAHNRLAAERVVQGTANLPWVILRPAMVYGPGDLTSITPRLSCAVVYRSLREKMRFLWGADLRLHVVHVSDMVSALWIAAVEAPAGSIYNLADQSDLTQGKLNQWLEALFGIQTSFLGGLVSNLARLNLGAVAADANDKHVPAFTQMCHSHGILNTPLSPYIDKELLRDNHLSVDGQKITKETSFRYQKQASLELVQEQLQGFIQQGLFPPLQ